MGRTCAGCHNRLRGWVKAGMRTHTSSITIEAAPTDVFAYLADAGTLPIWAIGFAKAIARDRDDRWLVTLASGETMPLRVDADPATGIVDFVSLPGPGVEMPAHTRVVPHGSGTLYIFSMHQTRDLPDDVFDAQVAELARELTVLKAHLESACPL
jgi:hypothetical protein